MGKDPNDLQSHHPTASAGHSAPWDADECHQQAGETPSQDQAKTMIKGVQFYGPPSSKLQASE